MGWKIVAGIIGGFIVAFLCSNIANLVAASKGFSALVLLAAWVVSIIVAVKSANVGKAWRRLLISSSALSFVVPLATFIYTTQKTEGVEVVGGLFVTGIFSVLFFLLGIAFLVVGLLVGRGVKVEVESHAKDA